MLVHSVDLLVAVDMKRKQTEACVSSRATQEEREGGGGTEISRQLGLSRLLGQR